MIFLSLNNTNFKRNGIFILFLFLFISVFSVKTLLAKSVYFYNVTASSVYQVESLLNYSGFSVNGSDINIIDSSKNFVFVPYVNQKYSKYNVLIQSDGSVDTAVSLNSESSGIYNSYYNKFVHFSRSYWFIPYPLGNTESEHEYWGYLSNYGGNIDWQTPLEYSFKINYLWCVSDESVKISFDIMAILTDSSSGYVKTAINGNSVSFPVINSAGYQSVFTDVSCDLFKQNNKIVFNKFISGNNSDFIWFRDFSLYYPAYFTPVAGKLSFTLNSDSCIKIYSDNDYYLLNVDNPYNVKKIAYGIVSAGQLSVCLKSGNYFYQEIKSIKKIIPSEVNVNDIAILPETDVLVITPSQFKDSLTPWISKRAKEGLSLNIVTTEEIYAWFTDGIKNPWAIRDFLLYVKDNFSLLPKYVLLVGNATGTPKNDLITSVGNNDKLLEGEWDFLPAPFYRAMNESFANLNVYYKYYDTGSDYLFSDPDGDNVPDFAVGRWPVTTVTEINNILKKIDNFETYYKDKVYIVNDVDANGFNFSSFASQIRNIVPEGYSISNFDFNTLDIDSMKQGIIDSFGSGGRVMFYTGHGAHRVWDQSILSVSPLDGRYDPVLFSDTNSPLIAVQITCFANGLTTIYYPGSLGRNLVIAKTGAVASIGATDYSDFVSQQLFAKLFFASLFDRDNIRLGDALINSQSDFNDTYPQYYEILYTYPLLGDPTMKLFYSDADTVVTNKVYSDDNKDTTEDSTVFFRKDVSGESYSFFSCSYSDGNIVNSLFSSVLTFILILFSFLWMKRKI